MLLRLYYHIDYFLQAATMFSSALSSGQLGPVISQFGLGSEATAAANRGDMQAFFKALEKSNTSDDKSKDTEEKKEDVKPKDSNDKDKDKDDDSAMSLD